MALAHTKSNLKKNVLEIEKPNLEN